MARSKRKKTSKGGKKVRVPFRRNRGAKPRPNDWTEQAKQADDNEIDSQRSENIVSKGDMSRQRTIIVGDDAKKRENYQSGIVVAMRGLYADVHDGKRVIPCTIRRILRTRLIDERQAVVAGDRVHFSLHEKTEGVEYDGVIEEVQPRKGVLRRLSGRKLHTIVANVDQVIIVSSAGEPRPKPHLIDRYIIASLFGVITPVVCMNKIDLDIDNFAANLLDRFENLGYQTLRTSTITGQGIDDLRDLLHDKESGLAGQSGVGKSSLLNAVQPGLSLRVGEVGEQSEKGRHTTTTAELLKLDGGGFVVDTPGIRSFDVSPIPSGELEAYFVEFIDRVAGCKYPDCTHTHEIECAIKDAVTSGDIHPDRYESYVTLFEEAAR
jgi:ribosome biogenesis GTPase / thiamine phosphate phosphatase